LDEKLLSETDLSRTGSTSLGVMPGKKHVKIGGTLTGQKQISEKLTPAYN
jgi:hypothetical protein